MTPDEIEALLRRNVPVGLTAWDLNEEAIARGKCGACRVCRPWFAGMYTCTLCGNKRCPHATSCDHPCSGSNAPGQLGSVYL